jgi:hypothetical protein
VRWPSAITAGAAAIQVQVSDADGSTKSAVKSTATRRQRAFAGLQRARQPWVVRDAASTVRAWRASTAGVKRVVVRRRGASPTPPRRCDRTILNWTGVRNDRTMTTTVTPWAGATQNGGSSDPFQRIDLGDADTGLLPAPAPGPGGPRDAPPAFSAATGAAYNTLSTPVMRLDVPYGLR